LTVYQYLPFSHVFKETIQRFEFKALMRQAGVISPTCLRAAFTLADPKIA